MSREYLDEDDDVHLQQQHKQLNTHAC